MEQEQRRAWQRLGEIESIEDPIDKRIAELALMISIVTNPHLFGIKLEHEEREKMLTAYKTSQGVLIEAKKILSGRWEEDERDETNQP